MDRHDPYADPTDDCYYQAGDLYRLLEEDKKVLLIENTARDIGPTTKNIKYRHAAHCYKADANYGERIAKALELDFDQVKKLAEMTLEERLLATKEEM